MASAENQFKFKHSSNRKLLQACKHTSHAMSANALNFQACNNPTQAKQLESNNELAQEEGDNDNVNDNDNDNAFSVAAT